MAKSWKKLVTTQEAKDDEPVKQTGSHPNFETIIQQHDALQDLLEERAALEEQMQNIISPNTSEIIDKRYMNEIPSFAQKKKEEKKWIEKKTQKLKKEKGEGRKEKGERRREKGEGKGTNED